MPDVRHARLRTNISHYQMNVFFLPALIMSVKNMQVPKCRMHTKLPLISDQTRSMHARELQNCHFFQAGSVDVSLTLDYP